MAAVVAPVGVVLHEGGHWLTGRLLGYPTRLNVASVSGGPELGHSADAAVALQAAAGPLVTIALLVMAALALRRSRAPAWALALALTAPLRFLVGAAFLFFVAQAQWQGHGFTGSPNFDEYTAARALGWSPVGLVGVQMAALFGWWWWSIRQVPRGGRWASVGAVLAGAIIGLWAWMSAIGPAFLR